MYFIVLSHNHKLGNVSSLPVSLSTFNHIKAVFLAAIKNEPSTNNKNILKYDIKPF